MSVTAPNGFVATGVHCGIRKKQRRDLAVLRSLEPATGAGMFTINRVQAAPVVLCKEHLAQAQPQAVVVNSGNANAATGANGLAHARATAAILALAQVQDAVDPASVVVDAKSGISGAGRELKASSHAGFVLENLSPYKVGSHQHAPEIAQALGFPVCFVPHLAPLRRGLLATCYLHTDADVRTLLEDAYAESHVVRVLPEGTTPELARVQGTDAAEIGVFADGATGTPIVVCALDNLGKGAAGQAIQNANLALGLDETAGLRLNGILL